MIKQICSLCQICGGTLMVDEVPCVCVTGAAAGYKVHKHEVLSANIFYSHEILEELDSTEYNALGAAAKDGVNMLLTCGFVDLNDGKAGKVRLWNWFGAESTTVANLTALME